MNAIATTGATRLNPGTSASGDHRAASHRPPAPAGATPTARPRQPRPRHELEVLAAEKIAVQGQINTRLARAPDTAARPQIERQGDRKEPQPGMDAPPRPIPAGGAAPGSSAARPRAPRPRRTGRGPPPPRPGTTARRAPAPPPSPRSPGPGRASPAGRIEPAEHHGHGHDQQHEGAEREQHAAQQQPPGGRICELPEAETQRIEHEAHL